MTKFTSVQHWPFCKKWKCKGEFNRSCANPTISSPKQSKWTNKLQVTHQKLFFQDAWTVKHTYKENSDVTFWALLQCKLSGLEQINSFLKTCLKTQRLNPGSKSLLTALLQFRKFIKNCVVQLADRSFNRLWFWLILGCTIWHPPITRKTHVHENLNPSQYDLISWLKTVFEKSVYWSVSRLIRRLLSNSLNFTKRRLSFSHFKWFGAQPLPSKCFFYIQKQLYDKMNHI